MNSYQNNIKIYGMTLTYEEYIQLYRFILAGGSVRDFKTKYHKGEI